jgi:uncharacterized protein (TIGR02172 family)
MTAPDVLGDPFATGRTAELYAWQEGLALKLFRCEWNKAAVLTEADKARAVHAAGLPVPAIDGVIQVGERWGIVYERVSGIALTKVIQTRPWRLFSIARCVADLHLSVHRSSAPELPTVKDRLARSIMSVNRMPSEWHRALQETLRSLPDGAAICHGDFHPENIVLTTRGPIILDWMDAASGSPLADVARSWLLLTMAALPTDLPGRRMIELVRTLFTRSYLRRYMANRPGDWDRWGAWQGIIAASRLSEDIPAERDRLIAFLGSWMSR